MDEDPVVLSPKSEEDSVQAANGEIIFRPSRVDHEALGSQRLSNPLKAASVVYEVFEHSQTTTYIVDFAPLILICWSLRDASAASKEPSAKALTESAVGSATTLPWLVATWKQRKSLTVARSGASALRPGSAVLRCLCQDRGSLSGYNLALFGRAAI
jgi:hypothetical protein